MTQGNCELKTSDSRFRAKQSLNVLRDCCWRTAGWQALWLRVIFDFGFSTKALVYCYHTYVPNMQFSKGLKAYKKLLRHRQMTANRGKLSFPCMMLSTRLLKFRTDFLTHCLSSTAFFLFCVSIFWTNPSHFSSCSTLYSFLRPLRETKPSAGHRGNSISAGTGK